MISVSRNAEALAMPSPQVASSAGSSDACEPSAGAERRFRKRNWSACDRSWACRCAGDLHEALAAAEILAEFFQGRLGFSRLAHAFTFVPVATVESSSTMIPPPAEETFRQASASVPGLW